MTPKEHHARDVSRLQQLLRQKNETQFCLGTAKTPSNTTRYRDYKEKAQRLDISHLDRVLAVDPAKKTALVEPRICMHKLIMELLPYGLMPAVLPEFKGITVGGAINGCGGESSSHKIGLFHDICTEYECLLGNGDAIVATAQAYSDLFHGLHGSYGSLALVMSAKISLVDAKPYVALRYIPFSAPFEALQYSAKNNKADFLEGIIFSKEHACVIEANLENTPSAEVVRLDRISSPWFYQHVRLKKDTFCETLPLVDYLFRYDKGAFWMGAYILRPKILSDFLLQGACNIFESKLPWLNDKERKNYATVKDPSLFARCIAASLMKSQPLYRLLHKGENWVSNRFLIQDFTLPASKVCAFTEHLITYCPVFPLWICPVKNAPKSQFFAPNALDEPMCVNIGVYGIANSNKLAKTLLAELEEKTGEFQGRKWLYTNSEYSVDDFWSIYSKDTYQMLRDKYHSNDVFIDIEKKIVNKSV